jgi:S-adenosylmethionine:tRNA-ribosyltransferase-isomerase (queuine synthetase)
MRLSDFDFVLPDDNIALRPAEPRDSARLLVVRPGEDLSDHIVRDLDRADYQTVFARAAGSVAAPTASLHFTPALVEALAPRGVSQVEVTLHVGAGTFLPIRTEDPAAHKLHAEWGEIGAEKPPPPSTRRAPRGGRIVCHRHHGAAVAGKRAWMRTASSIPVPGLTDIFITAGPPLPGRRCADDQLPPAEVDAVHAGLRLRRHGADAGCLCPCVAEGYRFYSYGDASLLFRENANDAWSLRACRATDGKARTGTLHTAHGEVRRRSSCRSAPPAR